MDWWTDYQCDRSFIDGMKLALNYAASGNAKGAHDLIEKRYEQLRKERKYWESIYPNSGKEMK